MATTPSANIAQGLLRTQKNFFIAVDKTTKELTTIDEASITSLIQGTAPTGIELILVDLMEDATLSESIEDDSEDKTTLQARNGWRVQNSLDMTMSGDFLLPEVIEPWMFMLKGRKADGNFTVARSRIISNGVGLVMTGIMDKDGIDKVDPFVYNEARNIYTLDFTKLYTGQALIVVPEATYTPSGELPILGDMSSAGQYSIEFKPKNAPYLGGNDALYNFTINKAPGSFSETVKTGNKN